ncbi:VOC family protein [Vibrio sp. PP-XX7]
MRLKCIHHATFQVRDLDKQEAFATDFGLVTQERTEQRLVMRTRGGDVMSYLALKGETDTYLGIAFEAEDEKALDEAIVNDGAQEVDATHIPAVTRAATLTDPDGYQVLIVHGVERRPPDDAYPELVINTPFKKQRFSRNQYKRSVGPAHTWRFGHIGLFVKSYAESTAWYAEKLGLIASDIYHVPGVPQAQICGFFRLNRGKEYVDHHCIAIFQDEKRTGCHHISYEAQDYEAQNQTHRFLHSKDYEPIWGWGDTRTEAMYLMSGAAQTEQGLKPFLIQIYSTPKMVPRCMTFPR